MRFIPILVLPFIISACASVALPLAHQYCLSTSEEERAVIRDRLGYENTIIECGE